jgi:hypothetical protein
MNASVLLLSTNGVSVRPYLSICSKFINRSNKKDLELRKS